MLKDRLTILIGQQSVSSFARKVGLSESLIRKYLAGSDPGLNKAVQISERCGVSLDWLATGVGDVQSDQVLFRQALRDSLLLSDYEIDKVYLAFKKLLQRTSTTTE